MVVGPFQKTEFFIGAGTGMHSNDARGATITEEPIDRVANPTARLDRRSPLLVRTRARKSACARKSFPISIRH